eukprot:COSAG06_NODE_193_length_20595_cov_74.920765_3_plen_475_part_00
MAPSSSSDGEQELASFIYSVVDKLPKASDGAVRVCSSRSHCRASSLPAVPPCPPAAPTGTHWSDAPSQVKPEPAPAAASTAANAAQLKGASWTEVEQKILALEAKETKPPSPELAAALNTYGENALSGRELELFGRRPLDEPLLVTVCKQCGRPIITAHFAAHRENCEAHAPAPVVQPKPTRPRSASGSSGPGSRLTLSRPGSASAAPAAKRQAIEARRPLRFVRTRDIQPVTERGAAPVPALCPPRLQQFPFQLGTTITQWQGYHSAQQARLPDGNILSARAYGTGGSALTGLMGGVGVYSVAQYGNVWLPIESNGTGKKGNPTPKATAAAAAAAAAGTKGIGDEQSAMLRRLFTPGFTNQLHDIPRSLFLYNRLGEIPAPQAMVAINGPQGYKPAASVANQGMVGSGALQQAGKGGATPKSPGRGRGRGAAQQAAAQQRQLQLQAAQQQQHQVQYAAQQQQQLRAQMMAPRP